ncbi:MAG: class I SAM-dependent methyltransferase [Betaproteobacteria bacterium]
MNPVIATPHASVGTPSPWVTRWAAWLPAGSTVLDLACGSGRHLRWLAAQGLRVTGVDRDEQALQGLAGLRAAHDTVELLLADIEAGPWPLRGRQFDAVLVTNYLWRPLLPTLVASVAPAGLLIYETFASGHARYGRPSRPDFLLQPGELLQAAQGMRVLAYEDGYLDHPPRLVQRICARREGPDTSPAQALPLDGSIMPPG